ncbi:MAG: DegV family protein [Candidatus Nanopelagicales bacterium]
MSPCVAVVTDSTSYLPTQVALDHHIRKVPVQVIVSGRAYSEGVDITTAEVAEALRDWQVVSTSRPSPADFLKAWGQAVEGGADAVVSAHLSSDLSGTFETALLAAQEAPMPVEVVDSRTLSMALGFACITGAELAEQGADMEAVAEAITSRAVASDVLFYVDTLEYLRRGGRMGKAAAAFGTALRVKPILHVEDGRVAMLEKARTTGRALNRLAELAIELIERADHGVDVAVQHIDAVDKAEQLAATISERVPDLDIVPIEIGAVVGAHVGPGMVSVAVVPRIARA